MQHNNRKAPIERIEDCETVLGNLLGVDSMGEAIQRSREIFDARPEIRVTRPVKLEPAPEPEQKPEPETEPADATPQPAPQIPPFAGE